MTLSRSPPPREQTRWPFIDEETRSLVKTTADRVNERGLKYGEVLRHRERHNPKFAFLVDRSVSDDLIFVSQ